MRAILLPIKPEHAFNILKGNKTLELRKTIPKGFKGWVYCYVTKAKPELLKIDKGHYKLSQCNTNAFNKINGTIPFRFWFDEYETYHLYNYGVCLYTDVVEYNIMYDDLEKLCLDYREIEKYGKGKDLYAWHIKNLEVFEKPMQLSDFMVELKRDYGYGAPNRAISRDIYILKKAPQSWQYVWVEGKQNE